jgi:hypothetical protein
MNLEKDYQKGTIFPGLRDDSPEPQEQEFHQARDDRPSASSLDWEDEPIRTGGAEIRRSSNRPVHIRRVESGTSGLWVALVLLVVLLAGATYYGYQTLENANIRLSAIPTMLKSLSTVDGRLTDVESQLSSWSRNWQDLTGRVNQVADSTRQDYAKARKHAEVLTAQLHAQVGQLQQQMEDRSQAVDARLGQLDTNQQSAQERIAQLQKQLADAQQQLASLQQETNGDLATLHQHMASNDQQLGQLTNEVERRRVNFELAKNQITNLSPDVTMDLTASDAKYQRFSGWVYFEPDHHYLWIRQQGVMQPIVFYDAQKSSQYEVVVTALRGDSAIGYLLVPQGSSVVPPQPLGGAPSGR